MLDKNERINPKAGLASLLAAWCFLFVSTAGASSLVPNMSSNEAPAPYIVTASTTHTVYDAYKAFDGNKDVYTDIWASSKYVLSGWLKIDLGSGGEVVNEYRVAPQNHAVGPGRAPKDFVFEGSHTGEFAGEEVALDSRANIVNWVAGEARSFKFNNSDSYRYYRLNVLTNNGDTNFLVVQELELDYSDPSIFNMPVMTSNTSPAPYVASSSSSLNNASYDFRAWRAFDGVLKDRYAVWSTPSGVKTGWLKIDLGSGQAVNVYRITCQYDVAGPRRAPRDFAFQGSNDGLFWVDLDVRSNVVEADWVIGAFKEFSFDNTDSYRYYRLNVTANNGDNYLMVQGLQLDYGVTYVPPSPSVKAAPVLQYKSFLGVTYPLRIAQDAAGDIFVANVRDHSVNRFDKYGHAKGTDVSVADPTAVAAKPSGELYIASDSGGIYKSGFDLPFIPGVMAPDVSDMVFDSAGYLYVADSSFSEVRVFAPDGSLAAEFGGGDGMYPLSLAVGPGMSSDGSDLEEQVYVGYASDVLASRNESMVVVYEPGSWLEVRSFGEPFSLLAVEDTPEVVEYPAEPYQIVRASGIAVDDKGRVYVADTYGGRIVMFDESGDYFSSIKQIGVPPSAVTYDADGRLLVSAIDGRVRIYSVDGSDVANVAPTAPRFVSPIGGVSVTGLAELLVKNSDDINDDALVYEFVLASDPAMKNVVWSQVGIEEGGDGQTSAAVGVSLAEDTDYYWMARSLDGMSYSPYSPVTAFFVNGLNSAPAIIASLPEEQLKKIYAEEAVDFSVETFDSDRDRLAITWFVDGELVSERASTFEFVGSVDQLGSHAVVARVSDKEFAAFKEWDVEVYRPNTKPVPPSVASPVGSEDVDTLMPVLTVNNASDAEGDKLNYTFEVSTVSDFSSGSIVAVVSAVAEGSTVTSATLTSDLEENTLYYWRAMAVEVTTDGDWVSEHYSSDPSVEVASFFVNAINDVSSTPLVSHPSSGSDIAVVMPELVVDRAVDVDINDTLTYQFQLASLAGFEPATIVAVGSVSPADADVSVVYAPGVELDDNMTYYWRARAVDDSGLASSWVTAYFFVNTENDAPTTPEAVSPILGAEVSTAMPELVVGESSDLDGDAIQYIFEVDTAINFDSELNTGSNPLTKQVATLDVPSWTVALTLAENTDYFWRVRATDGAAESPWSAVGRLFVNTANEAPTVPVAKYPSNSAVVNLEMPAFGVYESTDVDRDSLAYIYQVSKDSAFMQDVIESGFAGAEWLVDIPLDENGDYFWRAGSVDEHGLSSGWSGESAFRVNIANDPPSAPAIGWQHANSGSGVYLKINNSVDLDGDALSYDVEVYSDRAMSSRVFGVQSLEEGAGTTVCDAGQFSNGLYYWRARAFDGEVYGSWSGSRVLRVDGALEISENAIAVDTQQGRKRY